MALSCMILLSCLKPPEQSLLQRLLPMLHPSGLKQWRCRNRSTTTTGFHFQGMEAAGLSPKVRMWTSRCLVQCLRSKPAICNLVRTMLQAYTHVNSGGDGLRDPCHPQKSIACQGNRQRRGARRRLRANKAGLPGGGGGGSGGED